MRKFLKDAVGFTLIAYFVAVLVSGPALLAFSNNDGRYFWLYCCSIGIMSALLKQAEKQEEKR